MDEILEMAKAAKEAAWELSTIDADLKNRALKFMAENLTASEEEILRENEKDLSAGRERGLSPAMLDRLTLNKDRVQGMVQGLIDLIALPDPVGEVIKGSTLDNGLEIRQVRTPMGVIMMVYESRPNVTVDAASVGLKAGSAVILRGGSEALHSNRVLSAIMSKSAAEAGLPVNCVQMVPKQEHEIVTRLLKMNEYIDLVIPRGGERLISNVTENAKMPVIKHFRGLCHVYVDKYADEDKAVNIVVNSKAQRPSTCNSAETAVIHADAAERVLPALVKALKEAKVEVRGDEACLKITPDIKPATQEDWSTEYLDLIISIIVVASHDEALKHIKTYSSGLADTIVTENYGEAQKFLRNVDSAAVYVNASTRFTDGAEFGLGAEIGITTDKVFPRGPMGLRELTGAKYIIYGNGQIRK